MIISVPDIIAKCPKKLLMIYVNICDKLAEREDMKKAGVSKKNMPPIPVYVIEGSRFGGKTQFAIRLLVATIIDGYATSNMFCTITEQGSVDSMQLIDSVLKEAEEPVIQKRDSKKPFRMLSGGETINIDFLNKVDSKARQTAGNVLVLEEIEQWNEMSGNASLNTMIRHFDAIIILSNSLPRWAKVWAKSFSAKFYRVDYWENEQLERSIKDGLEKKKKIDPDGWARDVMYLPTGGQNRVFNERTLENINFEQNPKFIPKVTIISADVGAGGPDNSAVFSLSLNSDNTIQCRLLMNESIDPNILCQRIARYRVEERACEEVWDTQGIGYGIAQFRYPKEQWTEMGLVDFGGKATKPEEYYNARAESMMMVVDILNRGALRILGLSSDDQEQLLTEMRAHTFRESEQARTNKNVVMIEKKTIIKTRLGGLSPNLLDSLSMGIWRLLTFHIYNDNINNYTKFQPINIKGAPSL